MESTETPRKSFIKLVIYPLIVGAALFFLAYFFSPDKSEGSTTVYNNGTVTSDLADTSAKVKAQVVKKAREENRSKPEPPDPNALHNYYGLDLNLSTKSSYTIGSPAIFKYFKLKGSKHNGLFIISTEGLYFTASEPVKNHESYTFYKIYAVHGNGWSNESKPCPGKFFKLTRKFCVYPCDDGVNYKIGEGSVEQADEYHF